jgi:hypothetical protein
MIVEKAHLLGLRVTAHAHGDEGIERAIRGGRREHRARQLRASGRPTSAETRPGSRRVRRDLRVPDDEPRAGARDRAATLRAAAERAAAEGRGNPRRRRQRCRRRGRLPGGVRERARGHGCARMSNEQVLLAATPTAAESLGPAEEHGDARGRQVRRLRRDRRRSSGGPGPRAQSLPGCGGRPAHMPEFASTRPWSTVCSRLR